MNTPTLIVDFNDHPEWCVKIKSTEQYGDYKLGQLVMDHNNTLARIIHIAKIGNMFRIALIDTNGNEFASSTVSTHLLKHFNWKKYISQ